MAKTPRPRRKALFPEAMRPVPARIQETRRELEEKSGKLRIVSGIIGNSMIENAWRKDFLTNPTHLTHDMRNLLKREPLARRVKALREEIAEWEKTGKKRSRGWRGMIRTLYSPRAALRLNQMKNVKEARSELAELDVLKQLVESKLANKPDMARYNHLLSFEKHLRSIVRKSDQRARSARSQRARL